MKELEEVLSSITSADIGLMVNELVKLIESSKEVRFKKGGVSKVVELGEADKESSWKYFLTYYPATGDFTISLKRFKNQSNSFAILKLTDKVVEVESFEEFIEKVAKAYLILRDLKKRYGDKEPMEKESKKRFL